MKNLLLKVFTFLLVFLSVFAIKASNSADPLPSWNDGINKQKIIAFVKSVSNKSSADYVAPADRIATFSLFTNDGINSIFKSK